MEDQVVNTSAESTAASESTSDAETTQTNTQEADYSSREDTNTQSEESYVEGADNETELQPKSQNRFQELANENKQVRMQYEEAIENYRALEQQLQQQKQELQYNPNATANHVQQADQIILEAKIARLEEAAGWEKALAKFPQLQTDRELDDIAYQIYRANQAAGREISPIQAAQQAVQFEQRLTKKASQKAYVEAEENLSQKANTTGGAIRRSMATNDPGEVRKKSISKYRQTGDETELYNILNY